MGAFRDLKGQQFGQLRVIERHPDKATKNGVRWVRWRCLCDCGKEIFVSGYYLRTGHTSGCGCKAAEKITAKNTRHGHAARKVRSRRYLGRKRYKKRPKSARKFDCLTRCRTPARCEKSSCCRQRVRHG